MTSNVIYHDFRAANEAAPTAALTASVLTKGRKWVKTLNAIPAMANNACMFLCGACAGVSVLLLIVLSLAA